MIELGHEFNALFNKWIFCDDNRISSTQLALTVVLYYKENMKVIQNDRQLWLQELAELKQEHRSLDIAIEELAEKLQVNQLEVSRLKKLKLKLKDSIARIESNLIPDLLA
ncbi:MAG: hypothetical protein ACI9WC_001811 [Arenicella sp.]|jgi:hypothetical protein